MKMLISVFLLTSLFSFSVFAEETANEELLSETSQDYNSEVNEALNLDEEEIIDTGSTVGNGMPITPVAEDTTI